MRLGIVTIRLVAAVVLLVSFSDYWAYDRWDPTASMNSSDPDAIAALDWHSASGARVRCTNLPDDQCAFCSPLMAPPAPVVPPLALDTQSVTELPHALVSTALHPPTISASPPRREPTEFVLPLRV